MRLTREEFVRTIHGRLIVSCQAPEGHPLRDTPTIVRMAQAAVRGGAAAIRCGGVGGVPDVAAVRAAVDVPVLGLTKDGTEGVYITPTVAAAHAVLDAGAAVVAADGTSRPRPDGSAFADLVAAAHGRGGLVLADVSTVDEGIAAAEAGADLVATTLSGYTGNSPHRDGPDLDLVAALRKALPATPVIAEGRYHRPDSAAAALARGAAAVVVGTAITDPAWLTASFAAAAAGQTGVLSP
ncbi:putative N-acetylmannosamine-6-phosphate 2-epimerase [Amycolatopsis sp. FU40]|uniref:putative N-acetylmannosamine-6-phosphate 2-epimerase n=1 Tax=Amycolatopsis sp. FU40 TaxID=2914159 RepID=UPI001F3AC752|nr:putative N-acetylmannosamine-6-phosphate 2-epimerase [Amycolatopsis sp. FU40]UKD56058.1 putative N-acetylmannosamine-6-phosphate 2-epimerase [Amycolatopsis sp. FU40]